MFKFGTGRGGGGKGSGGSKGHGDGGGKGGGLTRGGSANRIIGCRSGIEVVGMAADQTSKCRYNFEGGGLPNSVVTGRSHSFGLRGPCGAAWRIRFEGPAVVVAVHALKDEATEVMEDEADHASNETMRCVQRWAVSFPLPGRYRVHMDLQYERVTLNTTCTSEEAWHCFLPCNPRAKWGGLAGSQSLLTWAQRHNISCTTVQHQYTACMNACSRKCSMPLLLHSHVWTRVQFINAVGDGFLTTQDVMPHPRRGRRTCNGAEALGAGAWVNWRLACTTSTALPGGFASPSVERCLAALGLAAPRNDPLPALTALRRAGPLVWVPFHCKLRQPTHATRLHLVGKSTTRELYNFLATPPSPQLRAQMRNSNISVEYEALEPSCRHPCKNGTWEGDPRRVAERSAQYLARPRSVYLLAGCGTFCVDTLTLTPNVPMPAQQTSCAEFARLLASALASARRDGAQPTLLLQTMPIHAPYHPPKAPHEGESHATANKCLGTAHYHGPRGWAGVDRLVEIANRNVEELLRTHGVTPDGVLDEYAMSAARAPSQESYGGDGLHWYMGLTPPPKRVRESHSFMANVAAVLVAAAT